MFREQIHRARTGKLLPEAHKNRQAREPAGDSCLDYESALEEDLKLSAEDDLAVLGSVIDTDAGESAG